LNTPWDGVEGSFSASSASSDFSFLYLQLYNDAGVAPGNCPGLGPSVLCYPLVQEVPFPGPGHQSVNFSFTNLAPGDYKVEFVGNGAGSSITANYHAVSSVPEPASLALALGGLGVIGWARRRHAAG
jgi:MYXO-CTERM domain-containing protein